MGLYHKTVIGFATIVATCVSATASHAQTPITLAMPSFEGDAAEAFQVNGDAAMVASGLRLTKDAPFLWGAALNTNFTTLGPDSSFSAYFTFVMSKPVGGAGTGADGLAFLVQTNLTSKPGEGRTIGYSGAGPSLAVEFDTYLNGHTEDPNNNHIGINLNGSTKSVAAVPAPFILNNGETYHVWVDYDGSKTNLEVRISDTDKRPAEPTLDHTLNLAEIFPGAVFLGFSAATGAGHEQHEIKSLYFHREFIEGGLNPSANEYVTDAAG